MWISSILEYPPKLVKKLDRFCTILQDVVMHDIQQALLQTIQDRGLTKLPPLRKLAELAGKQLSAQQVKHHLEQLEKKGFLSIKKETKDILLVNGAQSRPQKSAFMTLPIYGTANCGPALSIAEEKPEGFLKLSASLLKNAKSSDLFVVKASGDSMNEAVVQNKTIEDGDYLIIDPSKSSSLKGVGEVVLSIIDGAANVKKIFKNDDHIILASESTNEYPPIYIDTASDFSVSGVVVGVMKKPQ